MKARWKPVFSVLTIAQLGIVLVMDRGAQAEAKAEHAQASAAVAMAELPPVTSVVAAQAGEIGQPPRMAAEAVADLFAVKSWYVPPPAVVTKPVAPAFPYKFAGSMSEDADTTLFLTLGQRNLILRKGDLFDGNYRFDEITNREAVFTYLPLKQQQRLQIGSNK